MALTYIITGTRREDRTGKAFIVRNEKITYVAETDQRLKHLKMNCSGFYIEPGKVTVDRTLLQLKNFTLYKQRMIQLQRVGCTTLLVLCPADYEKQLKTQLKKARHHMINSSIDYVLGVSFPMRKLTPSLIRTCKREKVPFILAELKEPNDLYDLSWQWIRESLFPYSIPIVPDWSKVSETMSKRKLLKLKQEWKEITDTYNIPSLPAIPEDQHAFSKAALKKIGIYPHKGTLRSGCDLDYNLYWNKAMTGEGGEDYDKLNSKEPAVVVSRGKILKAGNKINFSPGSGREVIIDVPGFFTTFS